MPLKGIAFGGDVCDKPTCIGRLKGLSRVHHQAKCHVSGGCALIFTYALRLRQQATLAELTARSIADAIDAAELAVEEVYVCGGGASNTDLMRRLYRCLNGRLLKDTAELGIDPDWVEAVAFAWLARQTMENLPGNAPVVTGADGPRVLGGIYLA